TTAAPMTNSPAPNTRLAAPAAAAPAAKTSILVPKEVMDKAPCAPYSEIVGRAEETRARPALAIKAPAPTNAIAAPKATIPTAPAVNAGPITEAPTARPAIAATSPTIIATAGAPA